MARLDAIEKMLALDLIDVQTAREMENMSPYGIGDNSAFNV
jgi:hypothetical protein